MRGEFINEYEKLNSEDQKTFRRLDHRIAACRSGASGSDAPINRMPRGSVGMSSRPNRVVVAAML